MVKLYQHVPQDLFGKIAQEPWTSNLDGLHLKQHVHSLGHLARLSTPTARIVAGLVQVFRVQSPSTPPSMATCGASSRLARCSRLLSQRRGSIANDAIQSLRLVLVMLASRRGACMQYMLATSNSNNTCGAE
jgi:hypothetical protein